jgi:hypothetical protein
MSVSCCGRGIGAPVASRPLTRYTYVQSRPSDAAPLFQASRIRSDDELRMAILDFIKGHPMADVGDVAIALNVRLRKASRLCKQLVTEGYIEYG